MPDETRFRNCTNEELLTTWEWIKSADEVGNLPEDCRRYWEEMKAEMTQRGLLPRSNEHGDQ